jgi:hypothetical protein
VEIAMHRRHRRPRSPNCQLDLFQGNPPRGLGPAPGWSALPEQTRHALIGLVTRLLIAHATAERRAPGSDADER